MAFEKYINVPITVITTNSDGTTASNFALAKDFSFEVRDSLNQYRILGKKTRHQQYTPTANREISISMSLYIDSSLPTPQILCKLAQQDQGFSLKIGETVIDYCYIDSVNFSVSPFQPIVLSVSCKAYSLVSPSFIPSTKINENVFSLANGAKSEVYLYNLKSEPFDILEATININSNREIYYSPGSSLPMRCNLLSAELTAELSVSGVGDFISYEGKEDGINFVVKTINGDLCFLLANLIVDQAQLLGDGSLPCVCTGQQLRIDEGGFISGSLSFNSILI